MPMVVRNNIAAMNANRQLNINNRHLNKSLEKLSSGYRINTGADGPAGLIISEKLRAQTVGLERAVQNSQEATNVLGIAEGALQEMNEILKSMRSLALHAASSGITSPDQVAADQAEIDSGIQTIERIANTTKYSDQFLLNGNKELQYESRIATDFTDDHALLNQNLSQLNQVFKKSGYQMNIQFSGLTNEDVPSANSAKKAYLEASNALSSATDITVDTDTDRTVLERDQKFTVTGNVGTRTFSFGKDTHIGDVVSQINNLKDSTGVEASLIFDASATAIGVEFDSTTGQASFDTQSGSAMQTQASQSGMYQAGNLRVFNLNSAWEAVSAVHETGTRGISSLGQVSTGLQVGQNTDGDGRVYVQWESTEKASVYKDREFTMKVGTFEQDTGGGYYAFTEANNSGLSFNTMTGSTTAAMTTTGTIATGDIQVIQLSTHVEVDNDGTNAAGTRVLSGTNTSVFAFSGAAGAGGNAGTTGGISMVSGVRLGYNTDATGKIHGRLVADRTGSLSRLTLYRDSNRLDQDVVAQSAQFQVADNLTGGVSQGDTIDVIATNIGGGDGPFSGLYGSISIQDNTVLGATGVEMLEDGQTYDFELTFQQLGMRLSSTEYGDDQYVKIEQFEGELWTNYNSAGNAELIAGSDTGTEAVAYGRNGKININGVDLELDGIAGRLSTNDTNADLVFNRGELGLTGIAYAGYTDGAMGSRAGQMKEYHESGTNVVNHATQARSSTQEVLSDFTGGVQLQLGEGAGDQERSVLSLDGLSIASLGVTRFVDFFEATVREEKYLAMDAMLGGGYAGLSVDPVKALDIIDEAINTVSSLRARIGAVQANLLQTNTNSLNVAIENITKTESSIRDADMAKESTAFTKNQVLTSAATSMLAQANVQSQSVLQLLQ